MNVTEPKRKIDKFDRKNVIFPQYDVMAVKVHYDIMPSIP